MTATRRSIPLESVQSTVEAVLPRFQAVAEETRLALVLLLTGGERCVCELQEALDAGQSRLSFHLKKLKDAGIVSDRKEGRWSYYSLVPGVLEEMRSFLGEVKAGDPAALWCSESSNGARDYGGADEGRDEKGGSCCG